MADTFDSAEGTSLDVLRDQITRACRRNSLHDDRTGLESALLAIVDQIEAVSKRIENDGR